MICSRLVQEVMESRVEEIMDSRLSSLPDDIIHKILSTVPLKEVVRTCLLSSRWRYVWTSMPYLNFSYNEYESVYAKVYFPEFTQFVKHVMSSRNNQVPPSSVNLNIHGYYVASSDIEIIIKYILSHNVLQVDVECMVLHSSDQDCATLFSSQSLKRLSLTTKLPRVQYLAVSSTLELPALTTLYLSCVKLYTDDDSTLFSKCPNLKNLTLKDCSMKGLDSLSICHHQLSNLTLEHDWGGATVVNVVAPQLENLTIRYYRDKYTRKYKHVISAPNLISLIYEGYDPFPLSTDGFHSLEKVDLCIRSISQEAAEALEIVRLFQQIQTVKFLTLNQEILELLSSHVQVISHHPPPFANLKSLDVYPKMVNAEITPKEIVNISKEDHSKEVKNYLLDSSQGATITMVSRQEAIADMKATQASVWMSELQRYLDTRKDIIEIDRDHMQKPTESMYNDDDNGKTETHMQLISQEYQIVNYIKSYLENIGRHLTDLPASKRAMLQPCFSSLCAESNIFVIKMAERMKIRLTEKLNNASDRFQEFANSLQLSSS